MKKSKKYLSYLYSKLENTMLGEIVRNILIGIIPIIMFVVVNTVQLVAAKEDVSSGEKGIAISAILVFFILIIAECVYSMSQPGTKGFARFLVSSLIIFSLPSVSAVLSICGVRSIAITIVSIIVCFLLLLLRGSGLIMRLKAPEPRVG